MERYRHRDLNKNMIKNVVKQPYFSVKLYEFRRTLAKVSRYAVLKFFLFDGWGTICFTEIVKTRRFEANCYSVWIFAQLLSFAIVDN